MDDHVMQEITATVIAQIQESATNDERQAATLREHAEGLRTEAAGFRGEADNRERRAGDVEANAVLWDTGALVKRQIAAQMQGRTVLPTPGEVMPVGELGMAIGMVRMVPREDATPEELKSYRDLVQALYQTALHQQQLAADRLREAQRTVVTGQIAPEDLPEPDPLTASPGESGAHEIVPAGRPWTPDRKGIGDNGQEVTVVTSKRCCNGCGQKLGDVTEAEVFAVIEGGGLPDVRSECPSCSASAPGDADVDAAVEPLPAEPQLSTARWGIGRVAAAANALRRKSASATEPDEVEPVDGEPIPYQRLLGELVLIRTKSDARSRGVLIKTGSRLVLEPCEDGEPIVQADDVVGVYPVRVRGEAATWRRGDGGQLVNALHAPVEERPAYPDEPVTGPVPVDPQARQVLPSSHGAEDVTQAFPPVPGTAS